MFSFKVSPHFQLSAKISHVCRPEKGGRYFLSFPQKSFEMNQFTTNSSFQVSENFRNTLYSISRPSQELLNRAMCTEVKSHQNKKGQKNLGYPRKKQSFYKEKACFFSGTPIFCVPSYFEAALVIQKLKDSIRAGFLGYKIFEFYFQ